MSDVSFEESVRSGLAVVVAVIAGLAVIVLVVVGGWQAGWWFRTQDTNRQAQLDKQGVGYQLPLQNQISDEIGQVLQLNTQLASASSDSISVIDAQRRGTVTLICRQAAQVNPAIPFTGDQAKFVTDNCYAGSVSPGSSYNH